MSVIYAVSLISSASTRFNLTFRLRQILQFTPVMLALDREGDS